MWFLGYFDVQEFEVGTDQFTTRIAEIAAAVGQLSRVRAEVGREPPRDAVI
jgi:hypothetical protein